MAEKPWARVYNDPDAEAHGLIAGTQQGHPTSLEGKRQPLCREAGGYGPAGRPALEWWAFSMGNPSTSKV